MRDTRAPPELILLRKNGNPNEDHAIEHPYHSNELLYVLYDTTHLLKNFFGNFHVRRNLEYPCPDSYDSSAHAHFHDLEFIGANEARQGLRGAHKLRRTILTSTSVSKVSAKYALGK